LQPANLFPQFTVSGNISDQATEVASFFLGRQHRMESDRRALTAPIFRGGTLRAQQRAAYDAFDRAAGAIQEHRCCNAFANVAKCARRPPARLPRI
jgi:outer membrane protein TolC